jgi:hypothetical protein
MPDDLDLHKFWTVYERAQDAAFHSDEVMWQVTAIIWGANTVLLGFVLEAIRARFVASLIVSSVVGMVLTAFVARVCAVAKVAKSVGYEICQTIEKHSDFPEQLRIHTRIDKHYPKGFGSRWVYGISIIFGLLWLGVFIFGVRLLPFGR